MGERIAEIRGGSFGRRLPALVGAFLLALLATTTYLASAHPITVDGASGEWLSRAPLTDNSAVVARDGTDAGEYIWRDATGDQRNVFAGADTRVDLTQIRYTSTPTNLNVLVKVTDLDIVNGDGAAQLQLALDLDRTAGSGALDFVAGADTQVANAARWERLVQTRLGSGNGNAAIWSAAAGPPAFAGSVAGLGGTSDSIELSVPWSALGLASAPASFTATAALFRSATDDTTKEAPGSDALDVVSDYGDPGTSPTTDSEVGDGTIDYFAPVDLTPLGEVRGALVVAAFGANISANPAAEWVEVANATGSTINIGGYKLGDATTPGAAEAMYTFPAGTTLVAGQHFKVARSGSAFSARFGSLPDAEFEDTSGVPNMSPFAPWSSGSLDLLDAGDEIVVLDGSNDTVDAVPYGTGTYTGVGTVAAPGPDVTLQRNASLRDTDTVADISSATCTGDIVWTGAAGDGLWATPGNWNLNRVPAAADHVCISNTAAPAITFNTTSTIQSVTSTETLNVTGGTLTLQNVSQPSSLDAFNFTNGTIQGAGNLVVNGPTIWAQGQFAATATTVKTTFNGPVAINNGDHQLQVRELVLNGDTQWAGGRLLIGERAAITNTAGHTFSINTDDDTQFWFGNSPVINNAGVITKQVDAVGTNDTTTLFDQGITFNNTGSVNVTSGTLDIEGGGVHTGSFTAQAAGGLAFSGASATVTNFNAGSSIAGAGSVRFSGGTSNVNGSFTNTGPVSVTGGTTVFGVPLNGNALSVSAGALTLNQPSPASSLSLTGGLIQGVGNLTVSGATTWSNGGFSADFTTVKTIFNGPVTLNGGDHQLQVRELVLNAGGTWTSARLLIGAGATITNAAGSTFDIQTDDDTQYWFGNPGTINNAGLVTKAIDANGANDTTTLIDNGIFFNNTGSVAVASGTLEADGGGTSIGSFTPASGAGLVFGGSSGIVTNLSLGSSIAGAGSVRFGGGTVNVNGTFTNTGPVSMTGGTAVLAPPLNNNPLTATGGTLVLNAASSVVSTLALAGSTIQGAGNLTVGGATAWSSGGFAADTTSVKTIFNGPLTMNGGDHQLQVRQLDVNANASWTSARFLIGNSATVNNAAGSTFSLETDDDFQFWFGSASSFNNAGTVTKVVDGNGTNGTATTVDGGIAFNNTGTANVVSGVLEIVGGGTSTGAFSVPVGSVLQFSGGTSNLNAGATVNAPGVVRFTAGTTNIVGAYDVTGTTEVTGGTTNFNVTGPLDSTSAHTAKLVQTGGTVGGNDVLEIVDRFTWHGGTQTDVGETRITPAATLELTSSSRTLSGKRTLANQGLITWTVPGSWNVGGGSPSGATIRNSGTFELRDGQSISNSGGEVQFLNVAGGLVTKLGAPGGQTANWSAEDGAADPTGNTVGSIPGWTRVDNFTVVPYGAAGFPAPADAPPGAGANFFAGGPNNAQSRISQTLDVSGSAGSIDAGEFSVVLDGDLGGAGAEPDTMTVNAVFLSGATELGRATIGPVTAADRGNVTKFLHRTATATAPVGTRTIRLEAIADRGAGGSTYNNAFADNLKLRVRSFEAFAGSTTIDIPFDNDAAAAGTGVNVAHGTLNLSSGDVNDEVGRFDVPDGGALEFGGGTHDLTAASRVSGTGAVRVSSGTLNSDSVPYDVRLQTISGGTANLNSASTIDVLRQTGGTLGGTGVVSLTGPGASSWTSGTMTAAGTTRVLPGVTMNLSGANVKDASGGRLTENQGTWNLAGTGDMRSGTSTFVNTGTFDIQSDASFLNNLGGTGQFNNTTGTLKKTGAGTSQINMSLDNDSTVQVQAGVLELSNGDGPNSSGGSYTTTTTLSFTGGTHDLGATSSVTGTGIVRYTSGTVNVLGSYAPTKTELAGGTVNFEAAASTTQLEQTGGTLAGGGVFTINGPTPASTWTSGTMTGAGTTRLAAGATMNLSGANVKDASGGRLTQNLGTWNLGGTGDMRSGASTFVNTGTFDIQSDASFLNNLGGTGQFNNTTGTLKKTGAGTSQITMALDNDSALQVQAGTLELGNGDGPNSSTGTFTVPATTLSFTGGTYDLAAASSVSGSGTVRITNGTLNELGTYNPTKTELAGGTANFESAASTAQLDQSGGVLAGGGVFTISGPAASSWTSGTMTGAGTTRIGPAATMNVSGANVKDASGGRLTENQGTWNFGGTGDMRSATSTFANSGTFDIQTDADFINNLGGTGVLNNTGTLRKTVGLASLQTQITMSVDNTGGTIRAQTGVLNLQGGFPNYNSTNHTLTGGTYVVQDTLRFNSADVTTNNAKVVLDGVNSRVTDNAGTPLDAFRNFTTNGAGGDFSIVGGRNLFSTAARGPNLTNNGALRGTGTYFQNVTNNGHVAAGASPGILTVDGNYTQSASGTLDVEIAKLTGAVAGTDYDRLVVTGTATLGGTANAIPLAGFVPATGVGIDVVTAATRSGVFANVVSTPSPLAGNLVPEARYDATTAKLFVVPGGGAADDSVPEAAGTKTITVTLSAPSSETATVQYATADGTATAGQDYSARSGTLTFAPNDTSETFDVPISNDARDETDENFLVNLSNPVNTVLTDTQASVTILDDDAEPVVSIGDVTKAEGTGGTTPFTFNVSLSAPSEKTVTVNVETSEDTATEVADFTRLVGTVTFAPLDTSETVTVLVTADSNVEFDERFFLDIESATNAGVEDDRAVATIIDDDQGGAAPQLSVGDVAVTEDDAGGVSAVFIVQVSGTRTGPVSVHAQTSDGTAEAGPDYTGTAVDLSFPADVSERTVSVPIRGENLAEATEFFNLDLTGQVGATLSDGHAVASILDDDAAPVAQDDPGAETDEDEAVSFGLIADDADDGSLPLTYSLVSPPSHGAVEIVGNEATYTPDHNFNGGDSFSFRASDGTNFSAPATVDFQVGAENDAPTVNNEDLALNEDGVLEVNVLSNDTDVDGDDIFLDSVQQPAFGGTADQLEGGVVRFTAAPNFTGFTEFTYVVSDGEGGLSEGTAIVFVRPVNDAPTADDDELTFSEDSNGDENVVQLTGSDVDDADLTFQLVSDPAHGELGGDAPNLRYFPDANYNGPDSFRFRVSDGKTTSAVATISIFVAPVNDDPSAQDDDAVTVENTPRVIDVLANDVDVDGDNLHVQSVGEAGHGTVTLLDDDTLRYVPDEGFHGSDGFDYVASDGETFSGAHVSIEVVPAGGGGGAVTASIADVQTSEANSEIVFNLNLTGAADGAKIRVRTVDDTAKAGQDYLAMATEFTFEGTDTTHTVTVKLTDDGLDENDEQFRVVMDVANGGVIPGSPAVGTITDNDAAPSVSASSINTAEGDAGSHVVAVPVSLSAPSGKTVTIHYETSNGTALEPLDYAAASGTLTFEPGQPLVQLAQVTVNGDTLVEPDETLNLGLSNPGNVSVAGGGTLTIVNDDSATPPPPPPPPPPAVPTADLALTMDGPTSSAVDRNVTYTLGIRNNGPSAASGVVVTDSLADGMQLVSATVGAITCAGSQTVTCPVGVLPSGGVATATIVASITEPGVHTNSASVSGAQADPNAANNSAHVTTRVPLPVTRDPQQQNKGCTLAGTSGDDVLRGTPGRDVICGYGGNDVLVGFGGDDRLLGGTGNDRLLGGPGKDVLKGGNGKDELLGGAGNDNLDGGRGADSLFGERGNDVLLGSFGNDFLSGGLGKDRELGGPGKDRMRRDKADAALGGPGKDQCLTTGVVSFCP